MKNIFKEFKNWGGTAKVGSAIMLGGILLVGASVIYASNTSLNNSETSSSLNNYVSSEVEKPSEPLVEQVIEEIRRPYLVNCNVDRYFYDETDPIEKREKSIVALPGSKRTYMLSEGCDYSYNDTSFDVIASVSGTIKDKVTDPIFGNILLLEHKSGTTFIYASLDNITVNKGEVVNQGDKLAEAGTSTYNEGLGKSLHFEVVKDNKNLNPEKLYSISVENL